MKRHFWLLLPLLCSCQFSSPLPTSGHYEGRLVLNHGNSLQEIPVSAEIPKVKDSQAVIPLMNLDGSLRPELKMTEVKTKSLQLGLPEVTTGAIVLTKDGECFSSIAELSIHLCLAQDRLTIDVTHSNGEAAMSLTLDYFPGNHALILEEPKKYSLAEAVDHAIKMDFNSRIEFQHVMEARHLAANAYLNLLPHLGANSILAAATSGNLIGMLGSIGDLAPFLLPTRWLRAKEAALMSDAERDGFILMHGDAGVQVEGMAYAIHRDEKILDEYTTAMARARGIMNLIHDERTSDILAALQVSLEAERAEIDLAVREQKTFFAQAMGMVNPAAVTDLIVDEIQVPIEEGNDLDPETFTNSVISRSFELKQMDFLIHAAQIEKKATYFGWLDPAGDSSLGFGFGQEVAVQKSRINEMMILREQVQSIVLQKLTTTIAEYNDGLEDHDRSLRKFQIEERRMQRLMKGIQEGVAPDSFDLVSTIQDHLGVRIGLLGTESVYRMSKAKLNRLMLEGFYSNLSDEPK